MPAENKVVAFFLEELQAAHQTLEGTIIGVTHEKADWKPWRKCASRRTCPSTSSAWSTADSRS